MKNHNYFTPSLKIKKFASKFACSCQLSSVDVQLQRTSQYLAQAILLEVSTHPKPGLVTRLSTGSHNDMDIFTFMMSSGVLSKAFYELQDIGSMHEGSLQELFSQIRAYGIIVEQEMLTATRGVNTQRGILFAGGLLAGVAGYAMRMGLDSKSLIALLKEMTKGLVERELQDNLLPQTAGEKLFHDYGITGIRGEVENGFPSVMNYGLPALKEAFSKGIKLNDALVHSLITLMTVVEDSNVIWRTDVATLSEVQEIAKNILRLGSVFTKDGKQAIMDADKYFVSRRISPGGCADLLSITITFYLLENKNFPLAILGH